MLLKAFFVSIPHSGETIPVEAEWLKNLNEVLLMYDVDRYVNLLYAPVIEKLKIKAVIADIHRYVIDLNRLSDDVDSSSVAGQANTAGKHSAGLQSLITTACEKLMHAPISQGLHDQLVRQYFDPFHDSIRKIYQEMRAAPQVYHMDLHSMPSLGTTEHRDPGQFRPDIVISDGDGKSCSPFFKDLVIDSYQKAGFEVGYNWPYKGGRVTEVYGQPSKGQEAIQVELNRKIYMNEKTKKLDLEKLKSVQAQLEKAITAIYQNIPES